MLRDVNSLMKRYYEKNPNGHYFDRETLRFFGETPSTMHLLNQTAKIIDSRGVEHECYVLSRLQRNHPGGPRRSFAYFDVETLDDIPV